MHRGLGFIGSFGLGALAIYLFDPQQGRHRQALLRDQVTHLRSEAHAAGDVASRDLANRARGIAAQSNAGRMPGPASGRVLAERVRAKLGRYVSHPHALHVEVQQGAVTLSGPILKREEKRLMRALWSVRGVQSIVNHLDVHRRPDIPALQGGRGRTGEHMALLQRNWPPAWRLFVGTAGASLSVYGFSRRGLAGSVMGIAGLGLIARAWSNLTLRQLLGWRGRQGLHLENGITINAPVSQVFDFWRHPENFPTVMHNVRDVRPTGDHRYHWVVAGAGGTTVQWDAVLTRCVPNQVISWASAPGAEVEQTGSVYFTQAGNGTRLQIIMRYNPPAGALGEAAASLFHADTKSSMDEDLLRVKMFLETGRLPHDAACAGQSQPAQQPQAQQPLAQERPAVFAGPPPARQGQAPEVAPATGAGATPAAGARIVASPSGSSDTGLVIDTGGGVIGRRASPPAVTGLGLASALETGRQAVNEASAFQGTALLPEQRMRIAREAINLLTPYRGRDDAVEGLITVLEGTIENNQRLLDDVNRPKG